MDRLKKMLVDITNLPRSSDSGEIIGISPAEARSIKEEKNRSKQGGGKNDQK